MATFSCVLCCKRLGSNDDRRKVEYLPQSQLALMKDCGYRIPGPCWLTTPSKITPLSHLCRPCFRSIVTLEKLKKDVTGKEEKLRSMIRQAGVERGFSTSLQQGTCSYSYQM